MKKNKLTIPEKAGVLLADTYNDGVKDCFKCINQGIEEMIATKKFNRKNVKSLLSQIDNLIKEKTLGK